MKNLLLTLLFFCTFNSFGQDPDPNLFQTWYLNFVQSSDLDEPYEVSQIEPNITPTLTVLETNEFSGEGACNTFSGIYSYPFPEILEVSNFSSTDDDCGIQVHNTFEDVYFNFVANAEIYQITAIDDGLELKLSNIIFGEAIFTNFQLNANDLELNKIKVYPNPSNNLIFIEAQNNIIEKIEMYNTLGQLVVSEKNDFGNIDVSDFSSGIYFIEVFTDNGILKKKIVRE